MRFGRRARVGAAGQVDWCELDEIEVAETLRSNVEVNGMILEACVAEAMRRFGIKTPEGKATYALDPMLRREVAETARSLFEATSVKSFVALQARLEERVNQLKVTV